MDGFLIQFLSQAWRGIALIAGMLILALFITWRNNRKAKQAMQQKKDALNPEQSAKKQKKSSKRRPQESIESFVAEEFADDFFVVPAVHQGSIFDDEELFPDEEDQPIMAGGDDPLAELHSARQDAQKRSSSAPADDEEAVDLASLLSGMVDEPEEAKDYHLISDKPVVVKLTTKHLAIAQELLTILRDERDARLMVQIGDVAYRTLEDDATAKKTFTSIMKELSAIVLNPDENPPESADVTGVEANKMVPTPVDIRISSGGDTTAREMISILRDTADDHLIIQIGNTGYRTLVDNAKAKTGFSKIMKELSIAVTTADDNPPIPPRKAKPAPSAMSASTNIFDDDDDVVLPGDIRLPKMDEMPDSYEVGRFGRVRVKKISRQDRVEEVNIADAIEAYLQYKIEQTPEFQNRGIHIRSAFGGGVRIEVDGEKYEFVDEVEDDDARTFIKQAIAEWQERH